MSDVHLKKLGCHLYANLWAQNNQSGVHKKRAARTWIPLVQFVWEQFVEFCRC